MAAPQVEKCDLARVIRRLDAYHDLWTRPGDLDAVLRNVKDVPQLLERSKTFECSYKSEAALARFLIDSGLDYPEPFLGQFGFFAGHPLRPIRLEILGRKDNGGFSVAEFLIVCGTEHLFRPGLWEDGVQVLDFLCSLLTEQGVGDARVQAIDLTLDWAQASGVVDEAELIALLAQLRAPVAVQGLSEPSRMPDAVSDRFRMIWSGAGWNIVFRGRVYETPGSRGMDLLAAVIMNGEGARSYRAIAQLLDGVPLVKRSWEEGELSERPDNEKLGVSLLDDHEKKELRAIERELFGMRRLGNDSKDVQNRRTVLRKRRWELNPDNSPHDKARKAVTKAIDEAIEVMERRAQQSTSGSSIDFALPNYLRERQSRGRGKIGFRLDGDQWDVRLPRPAERRGRITAMKRERDDAGK